MTQRPAHALPRSISLAIIALAIAAFASAVSLRVTDPLMLKLADEFHVDLAKISWVVTSFTVGYAIAQFLFGPVGDRFGKYGVIAWGCIASGAASLFCALAQDLNMLLAARVLTGAMSATIIPLAMAWIGDVVPYEHRQPVLARFIIGQILGVSTSQFLGGLAADYLGWRTPFFALTVLFVVMGAVLLYMRRQLPAQALQTGHGEGHALQRLWREFAAVLAKPWARVILIVVLLEGAFMYGAFAFFAAHLHRSLGISMSTAGAIVMPFGFGGFVFATTSHRLVARLGEAGLARWGSRIILLAMLCVATIPWPWFDAIACFVMGVGFYMLHNTLQTNATQMAPERRGAAVSAFAGAYFVGQSTGIAIAGALVDSVGTRAVIVVAGVGMLFVAMGFVREKHQHA